MKRASWIGLLLVVGLIASGVALLLPAPGAQAILLPPGTSTSALDNFTGQAPGTLLANLTATFVAPTFTATVRQAVIRNASGTLDFYYQIANSAGSASSLARSTGSIYTGFTTNVGDRTDGAAVAALFVNGTVPPGSADRDLSGEVVGFNFGPPSTEIQPGQTSLVLEIKTNAINFSQNGF